MVAVSPTPVAGCNISISFSRETGTNQLDLSGCDIGNEVYVLSLLEQIPSDWTVIVEVIADFSMSDRIQSPVIDIRCFDNLGNPVTQFSFPITVCIPFFTGTKMNEQCLGYFDEQAKKWKCEDHSLISDGLSRCGTTYHLTNFALLLDVSGGDSTPLDHVIEWLSLGFLVAAIVLVGLSVVMIELYARKKKKKRERKFSSISKKANEGNTGSSV